MSENEVYQKLLSECENEKSQVNWGHDEIVNISSYLRCSRCHSLLLKPVENSFDLDELEFACSACGNIDSYSDIIEEAAEDCHGLSYRDIKHGAEPDIWECPECGKSSFLFSADVCLACGESLAYKNCSICHASLTPEEQMLGGLCSYHDHMLSKDD